MTRDDAIKAVREAHYPNGCSDPRCAQWCAQTVDTFVVLGALKLDEPQNAHELARKIIGDYTKHAFDTHGLMKALEAAGLEIQRTRSSTG